jgi:alanine racemase
VTRGPVAEISLSAIAHNLEYVQKIVKNRSIIAVVKADAYGHGASVVSKILLENGVSHLAVAFAGEARELRESGIASPLLVLFDHEDIRDYFDHNLLPVVSAFDTASRLSEEAGKRGKVLKIHLKIDTGMGRLGLHGNDVVQNIIRISDMPGIELTGIMSHFSEADLADGSYAMIQLARFNSIRSEIAKKMGKLVMAHIANSAAVMTFEQAHLDAVRPGLMLYGYSPFVNNSSTDLIPAMTVKARILCVRDIPSGTPISYGRTFVTKKASRIGVLAVGYADGFNRLFSNNAYVLVKGQKAPIAGRVCMDLTMIDLTDIAGAEADDEAVIIGKQGDHIVTADDLARRAGTISYEILTSLGSRSRRVYVQDH